MLHKYTVKSQKGSEKMVKKWQCVPKRQCMVIIKTTGTSSITVFVCGLEPLRSRQAEILGSDFVDGPLGCRTTLAQFSFNNHSHFLCQHLTQPGFDGNPSHHWAITNETIVMCFQGRWLVLGTVAYLMVTYLKSDSMNEMLQGSCQITEMAVAHQDSYVLPLAYLGAQGTWRRVMVMQMRWMI